MSKMDEAKMASLKDKITDKAEAEAVLEGKEESENEEEVVVASSKTKKKKGKKYGKN